MGIELFRVRYANFRILYYWFGLDSLSSLDQIISRCILDKNWDSIFSSYASVIVVAFDKPATKLI